MAKSTGSISLAKWNTLGDGLVRVVVVSGFRPQTRWARNCSRCRRVYTRSSGYPPILTPGITACYHILMSSGTKPRPIPPLSVIAKDVGKPPSHISKVLSGRPCRLELFKAIADAAGLTMDEAYDMFMKRSA